jgi:hypothetical protein
MEAQMVDRTVEYPCAIADGTDKGPEEGFDWCAERMEDGDALTLFVAQKSVLSHSRLLNQWMNRYRDVVFATARGFVHVPRGPVLALWPSAPGLGKLLDNGSSVTALCVASWNQEEIAPWVAAARPELLCTAGEWAGIPVVHLNPDVESEMHSVTRIVNHNNTISAGFEKRVVVRALLRLHDAGPRFDGRQLEGWALADGWSGKNPTKLARYAEEINAGKRPRTM